MPTNNKTSKRKSGSCPALGSAIGPFEVYEDYENGLHIIDGHTRVMLSDSYAYDKTEEARTERMEWIAQALTDAEIVRPTGCDSNECQGDSVCGCRCPGGSMECTLPRGHNGDHIACGEHPRHNLRRWTNTDVE